jgi:hypothetical protein
MKKILLLFVFLLISVFSFFKIYYFENNSMELKISIEKSVNSFSKFNYALFKKEDLDYYYFKIVKYQFFDYNIKIKKSELIIPDLIVKKNDSLLHLFDNTTCLNLFNFKDESTVFTWDKNANDFSDCQKFLEN